MLPSLRTALVVVAFLVVAPAAGAWTWPAPGPVLAEFRYGTDPYAAGQHRGIDVAGETGEAVVAPRGGVVSFVGSVPANGLTVTIETAEGYSVTLVHLGAAAVARGERVEEGAVVGAVGPTGTPEHSGPYVHLGVRTTSDPNGYLDPLSFLPPRPEKPATRQPAAPARPAPKPHAAPAPAPSPPVAAQQAATPEAPVETTPAAEPASEPAQPAAPAPVTAETEPAVAASGVTVARARVHPHAAARRISLQTVAIRSVALPTARPAPASNGSSAGVHGARVARHDRQPAVAAAPPAPVAWRATAPELPVAARRNAGVWEAAPPVRPTAAAVGGSSTARAAPARSQPGGHDRPRPRPCPSSGLGRHCSQSSWPGWCSS